MIVRSKSDHYSDGEVRVDRQIEREELCKIVACPNNCQSHSNYKGFVHCSYWNTIDNFKIKIINDKLRRKVKYVKRKR
jgi:hypothetical protein